MDVEKNVCQRLAAISIRRTDSSTVATIRCWQLLAAAGSANLTVLACVNLQTEKKKNPVGLETTDHKLFLFGDQSHFLEIQQDFIG